MHIKFEHSTPKKAADLGDVIHITMRIFALMCLRTPKRQLWVGEALNLMVLCRAFRDGGFQGWLPFFNPSGISQQINFYMLFFFQQQCGPRFTFRVYLKSCCCFFRLKKCRSNTQAQIILVRFHKCWSGTSTFQISVLQFLWGSNSTFRCLIITK